LAEVLIARGTFPIFHRFCDFERQKEWVKRYQERTFISCGISDLGAIRELLDLGALESVLT